MTIRVLNSQTPTFDDALAELLNREGESAQSVEEVVSRIIRRIRNEGAASKRSSRRLRQIWRKHCQLLARASRIIIKGR